MIDVIGMTLEEKIEFLRQNPIFWSRLGYERETGGWEAHSANAVRHKELFERGIVVHSSIIPIGWVGPDEYDYTETDKFFELLFSACPDLVFLPRVKVNVPEGWCEHNPDDVFVYGCGPRAREDIIALIGTEEHGSHPIKDTDKLGQQSFFSKKWISDASEALRRFVEYTESKPYADRIIGYHVAFGTSGETTQWGTWHPDPYHKGDYGISATKAFTDYAKKRGRDYVSVPPIEERFYIEDGGKVRDFQIGTPTLDKLFYHTEKDERCVLYAEFTADGDMDAIDAFGKVIKDIVPQKVMGAFYGYLLEPSKSANTQHTGYDRLIRSPYVDFVASPKGYVRISPTDPGLGQAVTNSINRKKLWVDELDNRTHLLKEITRPKYDYPAKDFEQTRAVYWREFTKNVVHHQGYWWMDLGGGWLDSDEIRDEVVLMNETSKQLYLERDTHKSVAEVLLLVNEKSMLHTRPNAGLQHSVHHVGSTVKECGVPIDLYRVDDLCELDLSQYKLIMLLNDYYENKDDIYGALSAAPADCTVVWSYAAGIIDKKDGSFGTDNVKKLTGFCIDEYQYGACPDNTDPYFPMLYIENDGGITPLEHYSDGRVKTASRIGDDGRTHIMCADPCSLTVESVCRLLSDAGVHTYTPPYCVVHTDNRFIYVLSEKTQTVDITFKTPTTCKNIFTGEVYNDVLTVTLDLKEGNCVFLKYL